MYETWKRCNALKSGEKLSVRQHSMIRLAMTHVTWAAHQVATFAYGAAGTTGLRAGTLQRLFRDMHAGTQHMIVSPPVFRAIGRELSGLAPDKHWRFVELV